MVGNRRSEAGDAAARELLLALATARSEGDEATLDRLLTEATMEPARSLVLIDTFVRLLLSLANERAPEGSLSREDVVLLLALVMARRSEDR